jgi:hypothetical protein
MRFDVLELHRAFPWKYLRCPCSSIFQSEARNTRIRSYARKLVLISFHLKLHTSHPSSGKNSGFQDFKVHRLRLSYCEALQHVRKIWAEDIEFFHGCGKRESIGEATTNFRVFGLKMKLARSATAGILIPTKCKESQQRVAAWDVLRIRRKCISCKPLHQHQSMLVCSQDAPNAFSTAVEAPGLEEPDPLQQEVDPKRLVSSKSRGPPRYRHSPTHMAAGGSVNVHHIACAWCELADCVDTLTHCAETLCVSTASTGDGEGRRQESSNPSQRQTRSKHRIYGKDSH